MSTYARDRETREASQRRNAAMAAAKRRTGTYHHGNLREHLMQAALEIIRESGPQGMSLRDAARRAGVSHTAPYRHFKSKEALLAALAEEGFRTLSAQIAAVLERAPEEPMDRLHLIGVEYVRFAFRHPSRFRVMFGPHQECDDTEAAAAAREAGEAAYRLLVDAMASAQGAGLVRPDDSAALNRTAWALVHGLAALIVDGLVPVEDESQIEAVVVSSQRLLFEGLRRGPG